jgi:hypothetical protein
MKTKWRGTGLLASKKFVLRSINRSNIDLFIAAVKVE